MSRIRTIKPEFWVDDVMVELPFETRLLFIGLWNFVDDEGYIEYKPKRIKMQVFPADDVLIEDSLRALVDSGRLTELVSDQGPLLQVTNWSRHQKVNRPTPTRFTGIKGKKAVSSVSDHGGLTGGSVSAHAGREGKGKERKGIVAENRPDVSRLCTLLADLIESNGSKRPTVGAKWYDAARLLIDNDKRPLGEAIALIQWCQADAFWRGNILSMPKFREKYDTLRLQRDAKTEKETPTDPFAGRRVIRGGQVVSGGN